MADLEEELSIIEEDTLDLEATIEASIEADLESQKKKKTRLIILGASIAAAVLLLILLLTILLSGKNETLPDQTVTHDLEAKLQEKPTIELSQLERMIKKANLLYAQGNRQEALYLFKQIAEHSESISFYNLGVARMKNEQYETAIEAFKKAIEQHDNICVASINAAVCAKELGDTKRFDYYIELASSHLSQETKAPLFSYYKALIAYYKDYYLESLSALTHPTSDYYEGEQNYMRAKLAFALNDPLQTITYLDKGVSDEDMGTLAMLYAQLGNIALAKKMFHKVLEGGYHPVENSLALAHTLLKSDMPQDASAIYKALYDQNKANYTTFYPIKVFLKPQQFDLKVAQKAYQERVGYDDQQALEILLHFAPYKIYDAAHTLGFIKKGSANIYIDDIENAQSYLAKGSSFSKVNQVIAEALNDALHHKLRLAQSKLESIIQEYKKHGILNYNLALIYAKLGDLGKAQEFFTKSYHLDAKNYMAGVLSIMCAKILGIEHRKQLDIFKENLEEEIETADIAFIRAMLLFYDKNYYGIVSWSEEQKLTTALEKSLIYLSAQRLDNKNLEKTYATQLVEHVPNDILAHTLYMHSHFRSLPNQEFSTATLAHLKKLNLSLNELFYGSMITQKLFIEYTFITGHLYELSLKLQKQMTVESHNVVGIVHALAHSKLLLEQHEEAFVLFNKLIDEHKQHDAQTLFLAALAATGGNHHANAIALLELANLKHRHHNESRYALALLYLEAKNYNAASMQLNKMSPQPFYSKHFNFMIDTPSIGKDLIQ